jgi:hypothetical protein
VSNKFMLSKSIIASDVIKHNSVKDLFNYINDEDVKLSQIMVLIKKANMKLRTDGIYLFIRKSSKEEVKNIICMTRK